MRRSLWTAIVVSLMAAVPGGQAAAREPAETPESRMTAETFAGLGLRNIGPALMSGRIADIAIDPRDQSTWYVAVGSGGVWKTVNAGTTWTPIFDDQPVYSIGCLTLDPQRPDVIWVGTGENVGGRHVGFGHGVYRSLDGGTTWEHRGLAESEHIGRIVVDPRDSDTVYVASQGPLWSEGGERGLFKSTDGGDTWVKILGGGPYTGVNEVLMDPRDPNVLFASTHQRLRTVAALINGGPETGIHKSTDGGETWREVSVGLPSEDKGRIGLAISPQNPDVVYATVELAAREGGFFRSADGGETWQKRSDYLSGGTGPHYYQEIFASPHRFDRVYQMDVWMHVTEDGGETFTEVGEASKHSDNHALAFDPNDPNYLLAGCDGGLYESWDLGATWKFLANLPVTQFYKVAVDDDVPFYNLYGGTQDNQTQGGPSRTLGVHGIRNQDWFITLSGDGHQPAVEPGNPDIVYSEWQEGNPVRYDRRTGEIVYIQPQPAAGEPAERFNWDAPILVSPHKPTRLYYASQRVWRSEDRGDSWTAISGDLTHAQDRLTLPVMGRVWSIDAVWDLWAMSRFGTITSLSESPQEAGLLWVGTDDGRLQVTENGGETWRPIEVGELPGVPDDAFVNDIKTDLHDRDTVYVALDDHKNGDFAPYLLRSDDLGRSWRSIAGDPDNGGLPDRHLVWRLVQDHVDPELLFAGTELGVFFSTSGGDHWIELDGGVPTIPFRDLAIQRRENDLVGASFGRGFFILDDYSVLREVDEAVLAEEAHLFSVRDAWWYIERRPLGQDNEKATQGDAYFTAPNPPFGAVFTYHVRDSYETQREQRRAEERQKSEAGEDTPYPGWDALREEGLEEAPEVLLTVRDETGAMVRRLSGPAAAGFHRVAWNLRHPTRGPVEGTDAGDDDGHLAAPGRYTVELAKRIGGELTRIGEPRAFEVVPLGGGTLPAAEPVDVVAFLRELSDTVAGAASVLASLDETEARVSTILVALGRAVDGDIENLGDRARTLRRTLADLRLRLEGDSNRDLMGDPAPPGVFSRLWAADAGTAFSTYGPTPMHQQSLAIAKDMLDAARADLAGVHEALEALDADLDAAGVAWTPGRKP